MGKWIGIIGIACCCFIGFLLILQMKLNINKKFEYTFEYLKKFREFGNELLNDRFDSENYQWLKLHSSRMQSLMGVYGISSYKPPYANYIINDHPVIVNCISEIKNMYMQSVGLNFERQIIAQLVGMVDDTILTYIGYLEGFDEELTKKIKNPFIWFQQGILSIMTFPFNVLKWSGIISYSTYSSIQNNLLVKIISLLVGILAFIGSIITIVTGYNSFMEKIIRYLGS